jgi:hypothetical protein
MIKIRTIRTAAMLMMICMAAVFFSCRTTPTIHYDLRVVKNEQGWGYEIRRNNHPFIYQEYIPAIEGRKAFLDKRSAKKTGRLVLLKLQHNQLPTVTKEELKEIGVIEEKP